MSDRVETGSVDQPPEKLREAGKCPKCGVEVSEDGEHDCNGGQ